MHEFPEDLARLDELLTNPALLSPIEGHWQTEAKPRGRSARHNGRPTISMATYVRLGLGLRDSGQGGIGLHHLRRICLIGLHERRGSTHRGGGRRPFSSDAMLCLQGARALARQGRRLAKRIGERGDAVRDRSRAVGRRVRQISRTLARRSGEAREQVIA